MIHTISDFIMKFSKKKLDIFCGGEVIFAMMLL